MVKVKIKRNLKSEVESVQISGHAKSAPKGEDLVCAAVSSIAFGTYNAIEKLAGIELPVEQEDDGGFLYFVVPEEIADDINEKVQLLLEGMIISLQTIEMTYGQYIKIS